MTPFEELDQMRAEREVLSERSAAPRNPTPFMLLQAAAFCSKHGISAAKLTALWRVMYDAALREGGK